MSSTFEDMNMEVCMEETPFEEAGLPAGDPGKGENRLPDGFMDSMDAFGENPFDSDGQPVFSLSGISCRQSSVAQQIKVPISRTKTSN